MTDTPHPPLASRNFGQLALNLLSQSTVPGGALDAAMAFRQVAQQLVEGAVVIAPAAALPPGEAINAEAGA